MQQVTLSPGLNALAALKWSQTVFQFIQKHSDIFHVELSSDQGKREFTVSLKPSIEVSDEPYYVDDLDYLYDSTEEDISASNAACSNDQNGYLEEKTVQYNDLKELKVEDLKVILREKGRKVSGTKNELIDRIISIDSVITIE